MRIGAFSWGVALAGIALCTPASSPAQQAGVLLGLNNQQSYRTLWIVFSPDKAEVRADLQDLVLPRADGFWSAHVTSWCVKDSEPATVPLAPASYTSHEAFEISPVANPRPAPKHPGRPGACKDDEVLVCLSQSITVTGLFPEYVSLQDSNETSCGVHPDGWVDYILSRLDDPKYQALDVRQMFGPSGLQAFVEEVQRGKDDQCGVDPTFGPHSWQLVHRRGEWVVNGWAVTARICGYGYDLFPHLAPPAEVVGRQAAPVPWDKITAAVSDATDAVLSPDGNFVLVLGKTALHAFRRHGTDLAPIALAMAGGNVPASNQELSFENVAMAEWAQGRFVGQWSRTLGEFLRNGKLQTGKPQK